MPSNLQVKKVNFINMPRLDWQDREFDTIQRSQKILPRKIIFGGEYNVIGEDDENTCPFLMLFDRVKLESTVTRPFKSKGQISCLTYGPYDNGHILVGLTTGDFIAFDSLTLRKICNVKISEHPVTSITIEPIMMVLVGVQQT
jgi:hypothetical protein